MFESLFRNFPRDIAIEIVLFEGRVYEAFLREYVSQVYAPVYIKHFGYRHNLSFVSRRGCSLPFYAAWADEARKEDPSIVKSRIPRGFMRPYEGIVPRSMLEKERKRHAIYLRCYFERKKRIAAWPGLIV